MRRGTMVAALAALGIAGCGGDDAQDAAQRASGGEQRAAAERVRLDVEGVPFTLEHPADFQRREPPLPAGFKAIVGIDRLSFLDVRLTAGEALPTERLRSQVRESLQQGQNQILGESRERRAGRTMISFDVRQGETTSRLRFFRAAGRTWELGCQWVDATAQRMQVACDEAATSVKDRP